MKKISIFLMLLTVFIINPITVEAKTLRQVYEELDNLEAEIKQNEEDSQKTEEQILSAKAEINQLAEDLVQLDLDMQESIENQAELRADIEDKKEELANLLRYLQISSGENEYLEYIFGAETVTDFIHRNSVVEEITNYNDELVAEMKAAVEAEIKLREELTQKELEMTNKQEELRRLEVILYDKKESLFEEGLSIEEELESTREMIDVYKDDCELDEDISVCSNKLPPDTSFWRPLNKGYVTSEWGYRWHPVYNRYIPHSGIDLGVGGKRGEPIYSSAAGKVSYIKYHARCGGNQVYINHNIKGKSYTTVYMHMENVYVTKGDIVGKKTVIGTVGGDSDYTPWDYCSTGAHLHFGIYNGITTSSSASVNPRTYVNFPSGTYSYFRDRITRY